MEDSDLQKLTDSAHYYMECSNKGVCDRSTGVCTCYSGYDGVACQRASCPGTPTCSGHGVCKTKNQLALEDNLNIYRLWDKDTTMGCDCDSGYTGPDCSLRQCKFGTDPLYLDDSATIKYSIFDFGILTTSSTADFSDGTINTGSGSWAIRFFDVFGEDWVTAPISGIATCDEIVDALEALPNNVIPPGQTYCTQTSGVDKNEATWGGYDAQHTQTTTYPVHAYRISYNLSIWDVFTSYNIPTDDWSYPTSKFGGTSDGTVNQAQTTQANTELSGSIYRLKFYGNPGKLQEPEINIYLDGKRPTLVSSGEKVITKVWTDGQQGENKDYFADHCNGVSVTIGKDGTTTYLDGLSTAEKALLKACLGPSDFNTDNNVEVYDWDYGDRYYPHMIKLVRTITVYTDGGYYAALYYQHASDRFVLVNPFSPPDGLLTDSYEIYTTKGTLALTSNYSNVMHSFASKTIYMGNSTAAAMSVDNYNGDISCEVGLVNSDHLQYVQHCLNKTDLFTILDFTNPIANPPHINLYTATRLITSQYASDTSIYMSHIINTDISTNWGTYSYRNGNFTGLIYSIYKFFPSADSTYEYVAPCSNRGLCQQDNGLCTCYAGYTHDDCSVQSSIAL